MQKPYLSIIRLTFMHFSSTECNKSNYIEYEHLSFTWEIFMFASNLLKESEEG